MAVGDALGCMACGLWEICESPHMEPNVTTGTCDVMIIGEAPGRNEDEQGKPFVGVSGQLLRDAVDEVGLDHFGIVYTNVLHCRPPDNKTPTTKQIKLCLPLLLQEIERYDPRLIILLGNTPLKAILGESGITNWRGTLVEREKRAYLPMFHPAYILRNSPMLQVWVDDFEKACDHLHGDIDNPDVSRDYDLKVVANYGDAFDMLSMIKYAGVCSWDTEVNGLRFGDKLVMMSFAIAQPKMAWAVLLTNDRVVDVCRSILTDENIHKIGHNIKFDSLAIRANWNDNVEGIVGDSMLLSYVLDPVKGRHGLKQLAGRHLGMYDYDRAFQEYLVDHKEANPKYGGDLHKVPSKILVRYAQLDAVATVELHKLLIGELTDKQQVLYNELIVPASSAITNMEAAGVVLDDHIVDRYLRIYGKVQADKRKLLGSDEYVKKYVRFRRKQDSKFEFNPNSPDQVRTILYDNKYCGLPIVAKTKTGKPTTKWDVIKEFVSDVPFLEDYRYYKLLGKMLSTYLRPAKERWKDADGRVRSTYWLGGDYGTETGRLASRDPNLQNIPTPEKEPGTLLETLPIKNIFTYTEWGRAVVDALAGYKKDWDAASCLLSVDYSGMELRTMASISQCQGMIDIFERGEDLHDIVTEFLFGVKKEDYSAKEWKAMRYRAKWVSWTLLFGGSAYTLYRLYGIEKDESDRLMDRYYDLFPEVLEYKEDIIAFAREHSYVESKFGRKRHLAYINDNDRKRKAASERAAINMPIQSAASDVLLCALIVLDDLMHENEFKSLMVNTVHDSLAFDVYPGELSDLAWLCKEVMEKLTTVYGPQYFPGLDFSWFTVPLKIDLEVGSHLGSLEKYEVK